MIRFKERLKRIGVIRDFTAPHTMTFSFACPHKFWLEETWFFTLSMTEENLVRVEMMITLSGWKHVKVYQEEAYMLQAFCEAHLEGLKASLELLETNEDDDFFIET